MINENGANDTIQLFTRSGKHIVGSNLSDAVWTGNGVDASNVNSKVLTQANGFVSGENYDAANPNDASAGYNSTSPYNTSTYNGDESYIKIPKTPADTEALGMKVTELDPVEKAREAPERLNGVLDQISQHQAVYGSKVNILENRADVVQNEIVNQTGAISAIKDADVAAEAIELTKNQILQQIGISTVLQANLLRQSILPLLRQS